MRAEFEASDGEDEERCVLVTSQNAGLRVGQFSICLFERAHHQLPDEDISTINFLDCLPGFTSTMAKGTEKTMELFNILPCEIGRAHV